MSFFVNASQEEAFGLVMDYLEGRRMKILTSNPPSYIRARIGTWASSFASSPGEVEFNITKRNGGSYVNLNFNFLTAYLGGLLVAIIGALIIFIFTIRLPTTNPLKVIAPWFALGFSGIVFFLYMGVIEYDASQTRKRFIEEFNMFIQSLVSKKTNKQT